MDPKFQTSFIPKKPIAESAPRASISLFLLISIIIFLATLGVSGYVFLEKKNLVNQIGAEQKVIQKNKSSFDTGTIESILTLNSRILTADKLLKNHISVTPIFDFLTERTLKNVQFKSFTFTNNFTNTTGEKGLGIQLGGQAKSWETLASQADEFGKADLKKKISEPKVSSFSLNSDGSVSFNFTAFIQPELISFINSKSQQ